MSFRYRSRTTTKQTVMVPVDHSWSGIVAALRAEFNERRPLKLDIEECHQSGDTITIKVRSPYTGGIRDDLDGWTAAGQKSPDGNYPWTAEIVSVDTEHRMLTLQLLNADEDPALSRSVFLYEPDYQELIRKFAEECVVQGLDLPELYKDLTTGSIPKSESPADLKSIAAADPKLRPAQLSAVTAAGELFTMVWGPPGTGKTFTLGCAVAAHSMRGSKVLVVAPTNSATDQAALAIDDARNRLGKPLAPGELVRPGKPQSPELEKRKHLMSWLEALREAGETIRALRSEIAVLERRRLSVSGDERATVNNEIGVLKKRLRTAEENRARRLWKLASEARIIVTTLTAAMYHKEIFKALSEETSAIVVDEASMVPRYVLARLLMVESNHLAVFGDLRQLGPVRKSGNSEDKNSVHWVGHSIFDALGAIDDDGIDTLERSGNLVMLTDQSRMNDDLCRPISDLFYRGKLRTVESHPPPSVAPILPNRSCLILDPFTAPLPPIAPDGVTMRVDTMMHTCERSAWVAIGITKSVLESNSDASVLLLSPFRNQADLLRKLVRANLSHYPTVRAGTVHICQGQEAQLVIFDPVQPNHPWLTGAYGIQEMKRLLCVAFSRAKRQILVLARPNELTRNTLLSKLAADAQPIYLQ